MSALEKAATEFAFVQEHLERAVARCAVAARYAEEAHQAAAALGAASAIADTEDVKVTLNLVRQQVDRVATTALATADTIRTVIHGPATPARAAERPQVPAPVPGTP